MVPHRRRMGPLQTGLFSNPGFFQITEDNADNDCTLAIIVAAEANLDFTPAMVYPTQVIAI